MDELKTEVVVITPEIASLWLKKNTSNRGLKERYVDRLANDMTQGAWKLTHQGIAFNREGTLIDGQHRLSAIVQSGVSVPMLVTYGVDRSSQLVMDDHARRTAADAIKLSIGLDVSKNHIATARSMVSGFPGKYWSQNINSKSVMLEFLQENSHLIDLALQSFPSHRKFITIAPIYAIVARAYATADHNRLREFCNCLFTGEMSSKDDKAAITLRNWMSENRGTMHFGARYEVYRKGERALHSFLEGLPLVKIYVTSKELFPIPSDERDR